MLDRDEEARTRGHGPSARVGKGAPVPRAWAVAAWVTCGLVWSLGLATIGLAAAGRVPPQQFVTSFMALGPLFGMPAALLGARIVQRRRGHRVGWILLAMGLAQSIAQTANAYAWLSFNRHGGGLPGTALGTWVFSFAWMPDFTLGWPWFEEGTGRGRGGRTRVACYRWPRHAAGVVWTGHATHPAGGRTAKSFTTRRKRQTLA